MCKLLTSITPSLCDRIFTSSTQWNAVTNFPETSTHAIDFGLNGLSDVSPFTARNCDGGDVSVTVVGDKGKGNVQLYNSQTVQYEEWWTSK